MCKSHSKNNRFQKIDFKNKGIKKQQVNNILFPITTDSKKQQISINNKYLKTIPNSNQKRNRKKTKIKIKKINFFFKKTIFFSKKHISK